MTSAPPSFPFFLGSEWRELKEKVHESAHRFIGNARPCPDAVEAAIEEVYDMWEKYRLRMEEYYQIAKLVRISKLI